MLKDRRQTARLNLVVSAPSTPVPVKHDRAVVIEQTTVHYSTAFQYFEQYFLLLFKMRNNALINRNPWLYSCQMLHAVWDAIANAAASVCRCSRVY